MPLEDFRRHNAGCPLRGQKGPGKTAWPFVLRAALLALVCAAAGAGEPSPSAVRSLERANASLQRMDYATANAIIADGLKSNPLYLPLWFAKARAERGLGNHAAAEEALWTVLTADPDNAEANVLAFAMFFDPFALPDPQKQAHYIQWMRALDDALRADILVRSFLSTPDMALKIGPFLAACRADVGGGAAGGAESALLDVLDRYERQEFMDAAAILASPAADALDDRLEGALNIAVGKALPWVNESGEAAARFEKAKSLGYRAFEADRFLGVIHMTDSDPAEAADELERAWRGSAHPLDAVLDAVAAHKAAGQTERALALIETAQKAFPMNAGLRAEKLLALRRLPDKSKAAAYEAGLEAENAVPALMYARVLAARERDDPDAEDSETAAMRAYLDRDMGAHLLQTPIDQWIRFGNWLQSATTYAESERLDRIRRMLWSGRRYADALVVHEELTNMGVSMPNARHFIGAMDLINRGMARQADLLLRRNIPALGIMDLAVLLYTGGRWAVAYPLLKMVDSRESASPWITLYLADIAIRTGERGDAGRYLRELWSLPSDIESLHIRFRSVVEESDEFAVTTLSPDDFRRMVAAIADLVVRDGGYRDSYDLMTRSPFLQGSGAGGEETLTRLAGLMVEMGQRDAAREILSEKLAADPDDGRANLHMALAEYGDGRRKEAERFFAAGLRSADAATREYILSWRARLDNDPKAMAEHLLQVVEHNPGEYAVRAEAIQALAAAHRYEEARNLTPPLEIAYSAGNADVGFYLADAYTATGRLPEAERLWMALGRSFPHSRAPLAAIGDIKNRLGKPEETIAALAPVTEKNRDAQYSALIAEACLALGDGKRALEWIVPALAVSPTDSRLLRLGAQAAELDADHPLIQKYAGEYNAVDPNSVAVQNTYGQALLDQALLAQEQAAKERAARGQLVQTQERSAHDLRAQEFWDELRRHNARLFSTNPLNISAWEREAEWAKALEDPRLAARYAWVIDRWIVGNYPNDPSLIVRSSISAAGDGKFRFAIPTLECLIDLGINSVAQSVYFGSISVSEVLGGIPIPEAKEKLAALSERHCHAPIEALSQPRNPNSCDILPIPLVVFVGRSTPDALEAFDAHLAEIGGRAVLLIGEESLVPQTAVWPDVRFLRKLLDTGRWQFVLTDHAPLMLPGKDGERTNFWLQAKWLADGERYETSGEMRARLSAALADLRAKAEAVGIPVGGWAHPSWGDYGQRALSQTSDDAASYMAAVRENFTLATTIAPSGYRLPITDPFRVPMRSIVRGQETKAFIESIHWNHPTRRAVLELAKTESWHGQLPAAQDLFCLSRSMGLDAREIAYFHARNYQYEGDVPMAILGAHEAYGLDPENERTSDLMTDAYRLKRPLLVFDPLYTVDSEDERHASIAAALGWHVTNKLELRVLAGAHRWLSGPDGDGEALQGMDVGAGARYYFAPQNWLLGEVRGTLTDDNEIGSFLEGRLQWHGAFNFPKLFLANGFFDIAYNREAVQTRRAMAAGGVFANHFSFDSNTRLRHWWEIDMGADYTTRDDGNDTWEFEFRPTHRIFDSPLLRVGYWGRFADSTFDPPEYYAPIKHQSHSVVAMFRYNINPKLTLTGLGAYGISRSGEDGAWGPIVRANMNLNWLVNDCLNISGGFQYMKSTDYWLKQFGVSVSIRF